MFSKEVFDLLATQPDGGFLSVHKREDAGIATSASNKAPTSGAAKFWTYASTRPTTAISALAGLGVFALSRISS